MQPPISLQTVLQNRYRLIKILGEGGFGRTYLAADLGRFNELCALKELIPFQNTPEFLAKAKQLFQKEASVLYKIHHPQIPQFRATFEQDERLVLVQDYIEGKSYLQLLQEKQAINKTFTEVEAIQLLQQLLPVLAHLHVRGIIHRDISPDNIIWREIDSKPVLIDFGVVNEIASRIQAINPQSVTTTVGKLGYAPIEQLQTGRAYASSDLYSLAVSIIVLLTGKQPLELFDDEQFIWNWQGWTKVSQEFACLLNRMLSYKPSDRYQSVAEVAKALQLMLESAPQTPLPNSLQPVAALPQIEQNSPPHLPVTAPSQINTMAIGRRPDEIKPIATKQLQPTVTKLSIWERWWAIAFIFVAVALIAGGSSLLFVSWLLNNNQKGEPQTFPSPLIAEPPSKSN
ncbi:serine/threonine-protein kinase [Synechocystis sp. PCC 7509]|uniref:serine/threonine-protein kinase n=1 Tax=Synechocystis sp. PCC 7509 TaxID=927677 RepID=UPI0002ABF7D1|nr:serine/threonine-protein kinase [Synechocystis sp. PCC 7509]